MIFLPSFETKEYLLPHLTLKEEGGGGGRGEGGSGSDLR